MTQRRTLSLEEFQNTELPHLADVLSFGNSHQSSVYADTTAVKSPEVVYRGLFYSKNRLGSESYLLNYRSSDADMGVMTGVNNYSMPMSVGALAARQVVRQGRAIALPPYDLLKPSLGSVARSRRSVRKYSGRPLPLKELSTLLFYAQGETGELPANLPPTITLGDTHNIALRSSPSGGGLYPLYLYFVALNVQSLEPGIYCYVPQGHGVQHLAALPSGLDLGKLAGFGEIEYAKAGLVFMYVYRLYENSRKYGDLGLSFALIEAGATAQNIALAATAMGVGTCDVGGYKKRACERLISVDGLSEHVVHMTVVGK